MRMVKKYLVLSVVLILYVCAVSVLMQQFYLYQSAYQSLSRLLSHTTVEVFVPQEVEE